VQKTFVYNICSLCNNCVSQSLAIVLLHVVFSTKNRALLLQSDELRAKSYGYLAGILRNLDCPPIQIGGVADHVHLLFGLSRNIAIAELVKKPKTGSSTMIKANGPIGFAWQAGYGAFSVSESAKHSVISYIANQPFHHRKLTFQEFRALLSKHGVAFDERYLWE
jgi:putative transposase